MRAKRRACSEEARNDTALEAASPASFQPWNAQTIAGARSPSGRRSQISGCIRTTVHHGTMASATSTPSYESAAGAPPAAPGGDPHAGDPVRDARQTIATLRDQDELDGVFACTRKERQISRAGTAYLNVELGDSTGTILARVFNDADLLAGRFERGELVHARGRVE